jgi:hypothetical protein
MSEDLERTYRIYGQYPEYVKGKLVKKSINRTLVDLLLHSIENEQKLHADVMHVDGKKLFVTQITSQYKPVSRMRAGLNWDCHFKDNWTA